MTVDVWVRRVAMMWVLVNGLGKVWLLVMLQRARSDDGPERSKIEMMTDPAVDCVIAWGRRRRRMVMVVVVDRGVARAGVRKRRVDGGGRGRLAARWGPVLEMAQGLDWRPRRGVSGRSSRGPLMMDWWRQLYGDYITKRRRTYISSQACPESTEQREDV